MLQRCLLAVSLLLGALPSAFADTRLGDGCDLSIFGVADKSEFLRFDNALRSALDKQDATALALLVRFPLALNYADGGRVSLNNEAALQKQFADAFSPTLRKIISAQKPEALFCKADGVMYGNGEIWVDRVGKGKAPQFRIIAVNEPDGSAPKATSDAAKVQLACSTDKFHIVIDSDTGDAPRYRSWNKPHGPPGKPALELTGASGGEGTGTCFHRTWRFKNRSADYVLSEPGCSDGSVPDKAKAQLEVLIGGKSQLTSWCY